jgi:hypothetical protein
MTILIVTFWVLVDIKIPRLLHTIPLSKWFRRQPKPVAVTLVLPGLSPMQPQPNPYESSKIDADAKPGIGAATIQVVQPSAPQYWNPQQQPLQQPWSSEPPPGSPHSPMRSIITVSRPDTPTMSAEKSETMPVGYTANNYQHPVGSYNAQVRTS